MRVRRLVFLSSQHLAQTEVHIVPGMVYCWQIRSTFQSNCGHTTMYYYV